MNDAERYQLVYEIVSEVADLPNEERVRRIAERVAGDQELLEEVRSLLSHVEAPRLSENSPDLEQMLDQLEAEARSSTSAPLPSAEPSSRDAQAHSNPGPQAPAPSTLPQIAGYRITGVIAQGGMGMVYDALQDHPPRRVALKLIRPGHASPDMLRRFHIEAEALGRLQHPGIARIFEAGAAVADGHEQQPFFAMEYIEGEPITDFAMRRMLPIRERVALMVSVCDAVHHAHQKGVIHRDLKPANVMVDTSGTPRVLDFGVARLLWSDGEGQGNTLAERVTAAGNLLGTLSHMSPEQLEGRQDDVDTRADVYALGVLGYQLLAGRLPHNTDGMNLLEAARRIVESPAPLLGTHDRALKGDLEIIVGKALQRDCRMRYQSASALSADLTRYLNNEPIAARPPTTLYHLTMFARRNRSLVSTVAALIVVLATALVIVSVMSASRARAFHRAEAERADSDTVLQYMTDMFAAASPDALGPSVPILTVLNTAAAGIESEFPNRPRLTTRMRTTFGQTYLNLGELGSARREFEAAYQLAESSFGHSDRDTLVAGRELARVMMYQAEFDAAETLLTDILAQSADSLGDDDPDTLAARYQEAEWYGFQSKYEESLQKYREVLAARSRVLGANDTETLATESAIAMTLAEMGRFDEAEQLLLTGADRLREAMGSEYSGTISALNNLVWVRLIQGRFEEAVPLAQEVYETSERTLGPRHPYTLVYAHNLASVYEELGRDEEAGRMYERTLELSSSILGPDHPDTLVTANNLALWYAARERLEEAEALHVQTLAARRAVHGDVHNATRISMLNLGLLYQQAKRDEQAEPLLAESLSVARQLLGDQHPETIKTIYAYAETLTALQRFAEAEPLALEFHTRCTDAPTLPPGCTAGLARTLLHDLYTAWGRPDEADRWQPEESQAAESAGKGN